jgi:hypothetical protein
MPLEEIKIPLNDAKVDVHWLPFGYKGKMVKVDGVREESGTMETFQGRRLKSQTSEMQRIFSGRIIGIGNFDEINLYNHDDDITKGDRKHQIFNCLKVQHLLGST